MIVDYLGQTVEEGDIIIYPVTRSSGCDVDIAVFIEGDVNIAVVAEVSEGTIKAIYFKDKIRQRVNITTVSRVIKIQPNMLVGNEFNPIYEIYQSFLPRELKL